MQQMDKNRRNKVQSLVGNTWTTYQKRRDLYSSPYLNVPIELAKAAYRRRLIEPMAVWLCFKFLINGQVRTGNIPYQEIADLLGYSDSRRVKAHLDKLLSLNWIGSDGDWLFIRSFDRLAARYGANSRKAAAIRKGDIKHFRAWTLTAWIANRQRDYNRLAARTPLGAKPPKWKILQSQVNATRVSCSVIGNELAITRSAASQLKKKARKLGYLTYRNRVVPTGLDPERIEIYRKYGAPVRDDVRTFNAQGLFVGKDGDGIERVFERRTSKFTVNLNLNAKTKLMHLRRRIDC